MRRILFVFVVLAACTTVPVTGTPAVPATLTAVPATATFVPSPTPSATSTPAGSPFARFESHELVTALAWSPDGARLAVAAGNTVHVYDARTLEEQPSLPVGVWTNSIAFHPTLPLVALAARDGSVQIWDVPAATLKCREVVHPQGSNAAVFSPDGRTLLAVGNNGAAFLFDVAPMISSECAWNEQGRLIANDPAISDAAFSPDGRLVAIVDWADIRLSNAVDRKLAGTLDGDVPILRIAISPRGDLLAAARLDDSVTLWDIHDPRQPVMNLLELPRAGSASAFAWSVAFSADGSLLAAGSSDGTVAIWQVADRTVRAVYHVPMGVPALAFDPAGNWLASGGLDAAVRLWPVAP
jgi:WD40 repeat protein